MVGVNSSNYNAIQNGINFKSNSTTNPQNSGLNNFRNSSFSNINSQGDTFVSSTRPKQEKPNKKALLGLGAAAVVGIGAAAYILSRGHIGAPAAKQLAEHIEFKEAQNMEEAVKFAKEHLGIEKFDVGNDLEIANWVNKGLTRVSNKYKGSALIPNIVETYPEELYQKAIKEGKGVPIAGISAQTGRMRVNTHYFNDAKNYIQKSMDAMGIKISKPDEKGQPLYQFAFLPFMNIEKQTELRPILRKIANGSASKMEIVTCERAIGDMLHFQELLYEKPELVYKNVLKSNKLQNIFKAKKDLKVLSLDEFKTLEKEKQLDYLYNLSDEIVQGRSWQDLSNIYSEIRIADRKPNIYHVIDHEIGHSMHLKSIGARKYNVQHLLSDSEKEIASTVSDYATTNSHEFVAEVHSELMEGHPVTQEVMDLYKKYGGSIPA